MEQLLFILHHSSSLYSFQATSINLFVSETSLTSLVPRDVFSPKFCCFLYSLVGLTVTCLLLIHRPLSHHCRHFFAFFFFSIKDIGSIIVTNIFCCSFLFMHELKKNTRHFTAGLHQSVVKSRRTHRSFQERERRCPSSKL